MSANLDQTNGQTSFVTAREDAWHRLGVTLPDTFTAEDAMVFGNLGGWNVRKVPLAAQVGEQSILVPGRYATVRDNPVVPGQIDVLGDVGEVYTVIQNEEHAGFINALVDESGAHFETAGAINGGRRVFITMKLPGHITVGGVDKIENYIVAVNSHDGSSHFIIMVTPVRVVCQNTLNLAFNEATNMYKVRHSSGAARAVLMAREALDMTFNYLEGFQEEAEMLINTTMTQVQFDEIIFEAFGAKKDAAPATQTRADNKIDALSELFADASTQDGIRDTAWAGLNALTEWSDHFSPTRGDERDESRAIKAVFDPGFKNRARDLIMRFATAA